MLISEYQKDENWLKFVVENRHYHKPAELLLKPQKLSKELLGEAVKQLVAWQKAQHKLPTWAKNSLIFFPSALSVEQASSERTACYKAEFVEGANMADLTGGMGIDSYFFSKKVQKLYYLEKNETIVETVKHNFELLGVSNVEILNETAEEFLEKNTFVPKLDWIYLDPARRNEKQEKIFQLADCEPNVIEISDLLFEKADQVLLKTSPFLDIRRACEDLKWVQKVAVVAVENECKEVLYFLEKKENKKIRIHTANWQNQVWQIFDFEASSEKEADIHYTFPQNYIYEPNAAILKAGAFKILAKNMNINKLHIHSHLYTSVEKIDNFAGRSFRLRAVCKANGKELKKILPEKKANLAVRNFPMSVEDLRKKLDLAEGGEVFIFATTLLDESKVLLVCEK